MVDGIKLEQVDAIALERLDGIVRIRKAVLRWERATALTLTWP